MNKTIIELVGVPGSGKSAVAEGLHKQLRNLASTLVTTKPIVYRRRSRATRFLMQARFHLRYWRTVAGLYRVGVRRGTRTSLRRAATIAVDTARLHHAAEQLQDRQFTIMDQGVLQQLIRYLESLPEDAVRESAISVVEGQRRQLAATGVQWFFLVVDTPSDIAAERIARRQSRSGEFDRLASNLRTEALLRTYTTQQRVLDAIREGRTNVAAVDGSRPLEDVIREAALVVESMIS